MSENSGSLNLLEPSGTYLGLYRDSYRFAKNCAKAPAQAIVKP
jgi:hypothetical protein